MSASSLSSLFNLLQLPLGRRVFALERVAVAARSRGLTAIAERAEQAAVLDRQSLAQREAYLAGRRSPLHAPGAVRLDNRLDRVVSGIATVLEAQVRALDPLPRGQAAARALARLLPRGAAAITSLSYADAYTALSELLQRSRVDGQLDPELIELGVDRLLTELELLLPAFRDMVDVKSDAPTWDVIRADHLAGQDRVLGVVAVILGTFPDPTPEHEDARAALLGPILSQQQQVRARLRARRTVTDLHADTGEEIEVVELVDEAQGDLLSDEA